MKNMKLSADLYWQEGQLVGPQHFDYLTEFLVDNIQLKSSLQPFPWGVYQLQFQLVDQLVDIQEFFVVMPNGQAFSNNNAFVEGKFALPATEESDQESIVVCLVVAPQPGKDNRNGVDYKSWTLHCELQDKVRSNRLFLPLIRLHKVKKNAEEYAWEVEKEFIPPTYKVRHKSTLFRLLEEIVKRIQQAIVYFPELQEAAAHIKFQAIYQSLAQLKLFIASSWEFSPFQIYHAWTQALATLRAALEINPRIALEFPSYNHYDLTRTFGKLAEQTQECLEKIVLSGYREREFTKYTTSKRFVVTLEAANEFYVLAIAPDEKRRQWLEKATIGYDFEIESLIKTRTPKISAQPTENLEITRYRDGLLYILKEKDPVAKDKKKNLSCAKQQKLVIAGHSQEMPERLILLFPRESGTGDLNE